MSILREVTESDLPVLFEQQRDPESVRMSAVPTRNREDFDAHWQRILADDTVRVRAIVSDGRVAGNVLSFDRDGLRLVGYWIGRDFWGHGLATRALAELLEEETRRPLHAHVLTSNVASLRVLEKCGFTVVGSHTEFDDRLGEEIELVLLELR